MLERIITFSIIIYYFMDKTQLFEIHNFFLAYVIKLNKKEGPSSIQSFFKNVLRHTFNSLILDYDLFTLQYPHD